MKFTSLKKLAKICHENRTINAYYGESYGSPAGLKEHFGRIGRNAMREIAQALELHEFRAWFNKGGIAVSGDVQLIGMWDDSNGIYISLNKTGNCDWILYRTVKHIKDYTGGYNRRLDFSALDNPTELIAALMKLRPTVEPNEPPLEAAPIAA